MPNQGSVKRELRTFTECVAAELDISVSFFSIFISFGGVHRYGARNCQYLYLTYLLRRIRSVTLAKYFHFYCKIC